MVAIEVFLDAFGRNHEALHRILTDLSEDELTREPHPPIGWLAWRLTRVMDNNLARLSGREQLWIRDGWATRFGMPANPEDYGRSVTHTREQVRAFRATAKLLLQYHDATFEGLIAYLKSLTDEDLTRKLDEPKYQPLPTVAVRLVSVLENALTNRGQISYLKAYHRLGGWFPGEAKDPASVR